MKYGTREATHGVSWGAFAKILKTTDGELDTSVSPAVFTGVRGVTMDISQDMNAYYADNQVHVTIRGNPKIEGSIKSYQIPRKFMIDHLGYKEVAETGALLDTGTPGNFVWQYIETVTDEFGHETDQLTVYYNVAASAPTAESATDEESVEPKEIEIPITASPNNLVLDADGKPVTSLQLRKNEDNADLFDLAYTEIIMPDTVIL